MNEAKLFAQKEAELTLKLEKETKQRIEAE
jgi:hypothetical protein